MRTVKNKLLVGTFIAKCDKCSGDIVVKEGKYGKFYACNQYPKCDRVWGFYEIRSHTYAQREEELKLKKKENENNNN